jgi:hypothetical protein
MPAWDAGPLRGIERPVPPFDLARLSAIGSLFVTRPLSLDYVRTREEYGRRVDAIFSLYKERKSSVNIGGCSHLSRHRMLTRNSRAGDLLANYSYRSAISSGGLIVRASYGNSLGCVLCREAAQCPYSFTENTDKLGPAPNRRVDIKVLVDRELHEGADADIIVADGKCKSKRMTELSRHSRDQLTELVGEFRQPGCLDCLR